MNPKRRQKNDGGASSSSIGNEESPKRRLSLAKGQQRFGFLMVTPSLVFLLVVFTFPLLALIGMSGFQMQLARPDADSWIGLANYVRMLSDARFWHSIRLTVIYTISTVVLQVAIGMLLAVALSANLAGKLRNLLRIVVLLPMITAPVVVGLVWRTLLLTQRYGLLDFVFIRLGFGTQPWLSDPSLALVSVIVIHTWQWTPFAFLVFLASLASVPEELYEAAMIDRASALQRFRYITVPILRPAIVIVIIIRVMVALRAFAAIFSATGGGPGTATEILNLFAYRTAFTAFNLGYGATLGTTLLVITTVTSFVFFRLRSADQQ